MVGDESCLPCDPLDFIAAQVQDDIVLLDQRDDDLFADAGVVTFSAGWSFGFDVGMTFLEIHGPVPGLRESGVITRARDFLMRLQPNQIYRRTNWSMTIGRTLDVSVETLADRAAARARSTASTTRRSAGCCICASRSST